MGLLLIFAFISGLVTILAPCIWPLLPIVISATVKGNDHKKPLGITFGVMTSFAVFTLSISYLVRIFNFDPNLLRNFAIIVIIFLGLTLVIPALSQIIEGFVSKLSGLSNGGSQKGNDFKSGFLTGLFLGIVWSPCGGPILASIATLAATGMVNFQVILVTVAYVCGVGLPLFLFTYGGQQFINKTRFLSAYTPKIQQIFGVIMIITAVGIFFNYDKLLQLKILGMFPQIGQQLNGFESNSDLTKQLDSLKGKLSSQVPATNGLFNTNYPAPQFIGITKWLNTDKDLKIEDLKGKVVLVDFWTYTCINCIRTLPHVTSWYDKYESQGFIVIGVHSPEFEFEKDTNNVLGAIKQYNIHYPVAQDNNLSTWNSFNNQYWPAEYLIDSKGIVRRTHFGEGEYDQTEVAIQTLLKETGQKVTAGLADMKDETPATRLSPETYIGAKRMEFYYPSGNLDTGQKSFNLSENLPADSFSLGGNWDIMPEYSEANEGAFLNYNFTAGKVFLVLRPGKAGAEAKIKVYLDGKIVEGKSAGKDVTNGVITVSSDRLYNLIDLAGKTENHILKLEFLTPGIEVFAFTFG